jgi:hypothetical protein
MQLPVQYLLDSEPWVAYRTRVDLLGEAEGSQQVISVRESMLAHPLINNLLSSLSNLESEVVNSHKSALAFFHRLSFLADVGIQASDAGVGEILQLIFKHQSPDGPFQVLMNIPKAFGGTGIDQRAWALCDSPLLVFILAKMGLAKDSRVLDAMRFLAQLALYNGYPCAVSQKLGKFRGPGRKEDACPIANLFMLKAMAELPDWRDSTFAHLAAESILNQWQHSQESHPYMFFMGTDFRKLKAPMVWYDIVHVADTLSRFAWLRNDPRLMQMADVICSKIDTQGLVTPESVWMAWKEWDFGQKKTPSGWLTFLVHRLRLRMNG